MESTAQAPTVRERFEAEARATLGAPVLWAARGPDVFDCSGLVTWLLTRVGARDMRATHTAQLLFTETSMVGLPLPGDLVFYGSGPANVTHVAIWLSPEEVISADGATSHITDINVAMANPANRVRTHSTVHFRRDFIAVHRNFWLDAVDLVCR